MSRDVTLYNLLISCPEDVKDEISLIESAVKEFNELYAEPLGVTIQTRHWSKSSYAQSGGKPQALLNEQFVKKCDAAVAIFWTRFGSPTDEYGSGTEEEIQIMLEFGKQVFMYFSDKPISPSQMNDEGYKRIQAFKEKYKDRGVYFTYSTNEEFKKLFFTHLSMHFLSNKKVKEATSERVSKLKLMGIDDNGNLAKEASVYPFILNAGTSMQRYIDTIRSVYHKIEGMNVGKRTSINKTIFAGLSSPVEIDDDVRKFITTVAEQLKIELPDDFFDLGNLNKDSLALNVLSGPKLKGTPEEIQKYNQIKKLHEIISEALEWAPVEKAFSDKLCLRLAIQNCGKVVDEDVEITFKIPQKSLLTLNEFPQFENDEMEYLLNDCDMYELFGINSTAEYLDYLDSAKQTSNYVPLPTPTGLPGYAPDYSDSFNDTLKDIFCYSIYPSGDNYIVKLKVDYIKHNTTVAFPSVLFVKEEFAEIPYQITSKKNSDIVKGQIKILTVDSERGLKFEVQK